MSETPVGPAASLPNPSLLMKLALAHRSSMALFAAAELDVFTPLSHGPRSAEEVARACGSQPEPTRILATDDRPEVLKVVDHALGERYLCEFATSVEEARERRAKLGSKRHLICDGRGVPLAIQLTGANRNDSQQALSLVDAIPTLQGEPGRPRHRPDRVLGDRGYDAQSIRQGLRDRRISLSLRSATPNMAADWGAGAG